MTDLPPSIGSTLRDYLKQLFNFRMVALLGGLQSNAESINQFREQVELIKPDSSRYELASYDSAINLNGRQI